MSNIAMNIISKAIKRKKNKKIKEESEIYAYMGSVGLSPQYVEMYQKTVAKIKLDLPN